MEFQYLLEGLRFYLLPSLLVALIPTAIIISITLLLKSSSNWKPILLCLLAGVFMWCDMAYWGSQGFLIYPFGSGVPPIFTGLFTLLGGIIAGAVVYRGTMNYKKNRNLASLSLMGLGYFSFVLVAFSILNNRGVA